MPDVTVRAPVPATLSWRYEATHPRVTALYERAKQGQWNASIDIDWSIAVPFGEALPDDSAEAMASFESSPLAGRGRPAWDEFRWELQAWMVSQFLHGEQGALVVAGRLVEAVPDVDSKVFAASQAADEARHVEVFARYVRQNLPAGYPICAPLESLVCDILSDRRWDITALGMQIIIEALAMAAFRLADRTFHDDLIKSIARLVARDEARHISFGVLSLGGLYRELSRAELADREDLVLEAAHLTRRRFLLEDVWERLGVPRADGVAFAARDELIGTYLRLIFAKVISALAGIGLLTQRIHTGLTGLGLLASGCPGSSPRAREADQ
jgi:hypothetical protein